MSVINIRDLKKIYNNVVAVDIPLLDLYQGDIVGLVGNNGAGKTTLLRLCLDLIKTTKGTVSFNGNEVSSNDGWKKVTGSYLDTNFLIEFLTAKEFLYFIGDVYGLSGTEIDKRKFIFKKLMMDDEEKYVHELSTGNKQKLGIISAMIIHPEILILDEPFNFLDPSSQIEMKHLLQKFNKEYGMTILLSSHNIQYITDICNRIVVLEKGRVVRDEKDVTPTLNYELEKYFQQL
jgi:ABC-2 type transport system ATP-binding protein